MSDDSTFQAGQEAGRVAQILREHATHFDQINGSIEKSAAAIQELASEIRGVREDMTRAAERVEAAREALATETESRRQVIADATAGGDRKFGRRERTIAIVSAPVLTLIGYLVAHL